MNPKRDFVFYPTIANFVLMILALFASDGFKDSWVLGLFVAVLCFVVSVWVFQSYFDDRINNVLAWGAILLNFFMLIIVFAAVHHGIGIVFAGADLDPKAMEIGFSDAVYFSIVTITTLGYGDFQPSNDLRLIAAVEAVFGYIYLGFFVASAHHYASRQQ